MRAETVFQRVMDSRRILVLHFPQFYTQGILPFAGIADIEHITYPGKISPVINERDSFGTSSNIPPHAVVPQVILRTGRCIRALSKDHELFMVWILV